MTDSSPIPSATQGEAKDLYGWTCPRCTGLKRPECRCHLENQMPDKPFPSAPKAEQVPEITQPMPENTFEVGDKVKMVIASEGCTFDASFEQQMPQEVLELVERIDYVLSGGRPHNAIGYRLAAALIVAERERHSSVIAEKAERYRLVTLKQDIELIQLRRELAEAKKKEIYWHERADIEIGEMRIMQQQLAALQREHDALLKISAAALNIHRQEQP